jgi:hypothetical protein
VLYLASISESVKQLIREAAATKDALASRA